MVGGPQIGYNYPGLTLEIGLHGPTLQGEGATSAPFPGYLLIGRGQQLRVDAHLGRRRHHRHLRREALRRLAREVRLQGPTAARWRRSRRARSARAARASRCGFRRTVHGPVIGYARVAGSKRVVALSQKRSSAGRETNDQIFFQDLSYGRVRSAQDFIRASAATPQTFNSFYADAKDIAFVTTGRLPVRPQGRQRRPAGRRPREVRVEGLPEAVEAPAGHRPVQRAARQLEQQAGQGLPRGRQPLGGGRHAARRLAAREPGEAGQAHAGHRARRRERRGDRRPARADVARRDGDPQAQARRPARSRRRSSTRSRAGATTARAGSTRTATASSTGTARPRWRGSGTTSRAPRCAAGSATSSAPRSRRASRRSRRRRAGCTAAGTSTCRRTCGRWPATRCAGATTCATAARARPGRARRRCGARSTRPRRVRPSARAAPTRRPGRARS